MFDANNFFGCHAVHDSVPCGMQQRCCYAESDVKHFCLTHRCGSHANPCNELRFWGELLGTVATHVYLSLIHLNMHMPRGVMRPDANLHHVHNSWLMSAE